MFISADWRWQYKVFTMFAEQVHIDKHPRYSNGSFFAV